jgi:hypothetical protein
MSAADRLDRHEQELRELIGTARRHLAATRWDVAATYAQIAAQHAWLNHAGVFASPELEDVLARLGARCAPAPRPAARRAEPRAVLHVLTQAYGTGGSTREVECWLEQDTAAGRRHRVCITRQGPTPPPQSLASRVRAPTDLIRLDTLRGGLMKRAAALRALAAEADVVVLHVHPHDVLPAIAFARGAQTPPVILVNHADHVFWLGTGVTDVLLNMRESGRALAGSRRGVDPARSVVMARPLMPQPRSRRRDAAKRALGLDPGRVLLVTAAAGTKYRAVGPTGFLDLVVPVLQRHDGAELLAAGPSPEGPWAEAERLTGGRVRALGRLPDVTLLMEAADVYLDSFPFSSLTSLLEAGSFGTPAITYRGHPEDCGVLGADTPGVDDHMPCPSDPEAFQREVSRAITDAGWRHDVGTRMERAIRETHTGDGWRAAIAGVYAYAASFESPPTAGPAARATGTLDVLVDRVMRETGFSQGPAGAVRDNLGLLPILDRARACALLTRTGARPPLRHVLPEWVLPPLADGRRRTRALWAGIAARGAA